MDCRWQRLIADFKNADEATVILEKLDGSHLTLKTSDLSKQDQVYVTARLTQDTSSDPEKLEGIVSKVVDGDTLKILTGDSRHTVRLDGIDAPETGQAFGTKVRRYLSNRLLGEQVNVVTKGRDKYGRLLGEVFIGDTNINQELVEKGLA